jgi:hypothetical protein
MEEGLRSIGEIAAARGATRLYLEPVVSPVQWQAADRKGDRVLGVTVYTHPDHNVDGEPRWYRVLGRAGVEGDVFIVARLPPLTGDARFGPANSGYVELPAGSRVPYLRLDWGDSLLEAGPGFLGQSGRLPCQPSPFGLRTSARGGRPTPWGSLARSASTPIPSPLVTPAYSIPVGRFVSFSYVDSLIFNGIEPISVGFQFTGQSPPDPSDPGTTRFQGIGSIPAGYFPCSGMIYPLNAAWSEMTFEGSSVDSYVLFDGFITNYPSKVMLGLLFTGAPIGNGAFFVEGKIYG